MRTILSLLFLSAVLASDSRAAPDARPLKLGIIGTGHIGGTLAKPWVAAGPRLVGAFNAINAGSLASEAHRKPPQIGIPLAGDDADALKVAQRLVRDAGFDPVLVGGLARARDFDVGTPVYTKLLTAEEL